MLSFLYRTFLVVMVGGGREGRRRKRGGPRGKNPEKNRVVGNSSHATTLYEVFKLIYGC